MGSYSTTNGRTTAGNASTEPAAVSPSTAMRCGCEHTACCSGTLHPHGRTRGHLSGPGYHPRGQAAVVCLSLESFHLGVKDMGGALSIVMPTPQNQADSPGADRIQQAFHCILKFPSRKPELVPSGNSLTRFCFCSHLFLLQELLGNLDGDSPTPACLPPLTIPLSASSAGEAACCLHQAALCFLQ